MIGSVAGLKRNNSGRSGLERQLQHLELFADIQARPIHVGAPGEFEDHVGLPGPRHGLHGADVGDHADRFLHGPRQQRFDFLGCGAAVFRANGQGRIGQVGQQVDLEVLQRDQAEQDQGDRGHGNGHASARGHFHDLEGIGAHALGCWPMLITSTRTPSLRLLLPAVTTVSPLVTPSRTSIIPARS